MSNLWPQTALLHDHGDGSITILPILEYLFKLSKKQPPFELAKDMSILRTRVKNWFFNPDIDIVTRFSLTTGVLQSFEALFLFANQYVRERAGQGFAYCEMTIAPQYHTFGKLTEKEVVAALVSGIKSGEQHCPGIETNIIFSVGREVDPEDAVKLVNIAGECDRDYVVGIGLVCDEANHPPEKHVTMFRRAKELGFKITCHAGEWVSSNPDFERDLPLLVKNIRTAVFKLEADRIGHAIGLAYDQELIKAVVDRGVGIEGCPGSNYASGLIPNTGCLKIRDLIEAKVLYSIHPDDDLFLPNLEATLKICDREYSFTKQERKKLIQNAWSARFGKRKFHS